MLRPKIKFAIEVNGYQHYTQGQLKPYYQERHDLIVANGWELLELPYIKVFNEKYVKELITLIKTKLVHAPEVESGFSAPTTGKELEVPLG